MSKRWIMTLGWAVWRLARRLARSIEQSGRRRASLAMVVWNDRMLRDIGVTRADLLGSLSSPWDNPDVFGHVHTIGPRTEAVRPARDVDRLAA